LPPGVPCAATLVRPPLLAVAAAGVALAATRVRTAVDVAEDRRNSSPRPDERALRALREPLVITVHLAPEDPRYADLRRNVLGKLDRAMAHVTIRLASSGQSMVASTNDPSYGEVEYVYGGRSDRS